MPHLLRGPIDLVSGESGPRLLPRFANDDYELAPASLRQLEPVKARWVLPGHGLPWEAFVASITTWHPRTAPMINGGVAVMHKHRFGRRASVYANAGAIRSAIRSS